MTAPTFRVYLGYGSTWKTADGSISWTEETGYVLQESGVNIRRGRSSELDEDRAGTLSLTLNNSSRRFDPVYAAGDLFGDLKPGVPIKVEAVANSTTFPVFRGFVDGWPQDYLLGNELAVVNLTATDGFAKLAQAKLPESVYAYEVDADSPTAWWKLDETSGTLIADSAGNADGTTIEGMSDRVAVEDVNGTVPLAGVLFDGSSQAAFAESLDVVKIDDDFMASVVVRFDPELHNGTTTVWTVIHQGIGSTRQFRLALENYSAVPLNSSLFAVMSDITNGTAFADISGTGLLDGRVHHIVYRLANGGTGTLWVDGENVTTSTATRTASDNKNSTAGTNIGATKAGLLHPFMGFISNVAIWHTAPASARIADHWAAVSEAWSGDTTGARIGRLLDVVGWPSGLRDLAAGSSTLGPAVLNGTCLPLLKRVQAVEQGRLFMSADGKVSFLARHYHQTVTEGSTIQATFSDDGSDIPYASLSLDDGSAMVRNAVRASRPGGAEFVARDATSADDYGEVEDSTLVNVDFPADVVARNAAEHRLARYKDPTTRTRPVGVKLHGLTAAQQATVLGLELGYRVNVERTPQGVGSAIDLEVAVEEITHRIGPGTWETTFALSPAETVTYALWDTGEWDSGLWAF